MVNDSPGGGITIGPGKISEKNGCARSGDTLDLVPQLVAGVDVVEQAVGENDVKGIRHQGCLFRVRQQKRYRRDQVRVINGHARMVEHGGGEIQRGDAPSGPVAQDIDSDPAGAGAQVHGSDLVNGSDELQ